MVVLDATIVNVALPDIRSALGFSETGLSWVLNAYSLVFGGLLLLGSRAGDILGRRRTFVAGIGVFTVASLAGGFAQSGGELLAARAIQGLGAAIAAPQGLALLTTMYADGEDRNRALGLYSAVSIGGSAVGLIAGGLLTEWVSWRWVLFVNVPIGAVVALLSMRFLPDSGRNRGSFDLAGAVTSTIGMSGLVYGFVRAGSSGWSDPATIGAFLVGVVLLASFVVIERRATQPITPLVLFLERNRNVALVGRILMTAGLFGMFFFLTQFMQDVIGYSPVQTGLAFLPMTAGLFVASQLSARVVMTKIGARMTTAVGLGLGLVGLAWLTQLTEQAGYADLVGPLLLVGVGAGCAFLPLTALALSGVAPADAGAASGLVNVMQQVGGALGLSVLVTIFGTSSRNARADGAATRTGTDLAHYVMTQASASAFVGAAIFTAAALVAVVVLVRTPRPAPLLPAPRPEPEPVAQA